MIYFTEIRPTDHYLEEHSEDGKLELVLRIIFEAKNPRKKGNKYEMENRKYYILFELKDNIIYIINAKCIK